MIYYVNYTVKVLTTERWVNNETIQFCVNGSFKTKQFSLCEITFNTTCLIVLTQ